MATPLPAAAPNDGMVQDSKLVADWKAHYSDMPLEDFAQKIHQKFYSDMPFDQFAQKTGIGFQETLDQLSQMTQDPGKAAFDQDVEQRAQQAIKATPGGFSTGALGLTRGMTGNFADRIVAAPLAIIDSWGHPENFGREYDKNVAAMKREWELRQQANPVAATASELGGGLAAGGGLANAGVTLMKPGMSLGGRLAAGAAEGAGYGAVYGAGDAKKGEMLQGAGQGALGGAAVGAALPAIGAGLKGAYDVVDSALSPYLRPETFAAKKVAQRLAADNKSIPGIQQKLDDNPGLSVADVAGENTRGLTRTAVNVPGAGRQKITTRVNVGQMGQGQRIANAVSDNIGNPEGWQAAADDIRLRQETEASPLYKSAFSANPAVDVSGVVSKIDNDIAPGIASMKAPANLSPDSITGQIARIRSQLIGPTGVMKSSLDQLHLLKMDLDGLIQTAQRAGNKTLASKVLGVQKSLLRQMDAASPVYAKARAKFAGEAKLQNALDTGYEFITKNGDATAADIAKMTPSEREMFRLGVARGLKETIDNAPDGADVVKRIYGSRAKRAALSFSFETPQSRKAFDQAMINEARRTRTRQAVVGNSTTARQQADLEDAGIDPTMIGNVASGNWGAAIKALVSRAGARIGGVTPKVASSIADLTMTRDPASLNRMLQLLQQASQRSQGLENGYTRALQGAVPALTAATNNQ